MRRARRRSSAALPAPSASALASARARAARRASVTRLGYAILFVSDLDRSVAFYRDLLGLPFRFANESYAEFATEGAKFSLYASRICRS